MTAEVNNEGQAAESGAAPATAPESQGSLLTQQPDQQEPQAVQDKPTDADPVAKAEGDKEENSAGKKSAPEEYADFTLAEGVELDAEVLGEFKGLAKEIGLTQEQAQKLVDMQMQMETKRGEGLQQALSEQAKRWADEVRADKEIGGENYDKSVATAIKAMEKFGTPELRSLLNQSGLGNHPELVKLFHRIGSSISEDGLVMGGSQDNKKGKNIEDRLWG